MMEQADVLKFTRREVRYHLYRFRTERLGGPKASKSKRAKALRAWYEEQDGFTDWIHFAERWDVGDEGEHHRLVKRKIGELAEWNGRLANLVTDLQPSERE